MATTTVGATSTTKNFHDAIRSTFTRAQTGFATTADNTTSVGFHLESGAEATKSLFRFTKENSYTVLKLMKEQTKYLKQLAGSGGLGGGPLGGIKSWAKNKLEGLIWTPIKNMFKSLGKGILAIGGAGFAIIKTLGKPLYEGAAGLARKAIQGTFSVARKMIEPAFNMVKSAGRVVTKGIAGGFSKVFNSGLFKAIGGIAESIGGVAKAPGAKNILKVGSKLLPKLGRMALLVSDFFLIGDVITAGMALFDGASGWKHADKILGKDKSKLTFTDKISSSIGSIINGIGFGLPDMITQYFGGKNLASAIDTGLNSSGSSLMSMGKKILNVGLDVFGKGAELIANLKNTLPTPAELLAAVTSFPGKVSDAFGTVKDVIWNGLTGFIGYVKNGIADWFKGLGKDFSAWWAAKTGANAGVANAGAVGAMGAAMDNGAHNTTTGIPNTNSSGQLVGPGQTPTPSQDTGILPNVDTVAPNAARSSTNTDILGAGSTGSIPGTSNIAYNPTIGKPSSSSLTNGRGRVISTADTSMPSEKRALLDTIAGTESGGYNELYKGQHFSSYADHPRVAELITTGPNAGKTSSAAGRYQFLASTWDSLKRTYNKQNPNATVTDFSPKNQDKLAYFDAQQVYARKTGRVLDADLKSKDPKVLAGIGTALHSEWTSLPGGIEQGQGNTSSAFASRFNTNLDRNKSYEMPNPTPPVGSANPPNPAIPSIANMVRNSTVVNNGSSTFLAGAGQGAMSGNAPTSLKDSLGIQSSPATSVSGNNSPMPSQAQPVSMNDLNRINQANTAVPDFAPAANPASLPAQAVPSLPDQNGGTANTPVAQTGPTGVAPGSFKVSDLEPMDETKMLMVNGSRIVS